MSDDQDDEDPDPRSPLTAGLEKRALLEMRAVLTANTLRPFYSLLVTAGHSGIVSIIDSDSVNLEDIPAAFDDISDAATKALKRLLKLLEDAGKTLAPAESVPGANVDERCRQVHKVICLFNKHLTDSRARATELAIKLTANDEEGSEEDEAGKSAKKKANKKKKRASRAASEGVLRGVPGCAGGFSSLQNSFTKLSARVVHSRQKLGLPQSPRIAAAPPFVATSAATREDRDASADEAAATGPRFLVKSWTRKERTMELGTKIPP